ncbi:MAG: helix-turn-helix domain-containing protein [Proteobacteria bacterium]|nr:helix-turn-helix domain-containing protein [Pseudomonadota bacterium]
MDTHLTYEQVSIRLGIKRNTLYSLVHKHRIPHVRLGKRLVRFPEHQLEQWIADSLVLPTGLKREDAAINEMQASE